MSEQWQKLRDALTASVVKRTRDYVGKQKFDLISEKGQSDVVETAELLVECQLLRAAGEDVSAAELALKAVIANWATAGHIKASQHTDEFLNELKEGLIEAGQIVLSMIGAGIKGMVTG